MREGWKGEPALPPKRKYFIDKNFNKMSESLIATLVIIAATFFIETHQNLRVR